MQPIALDTLLQQRYRILDNLGEGGFGRTYLATDCGRFDEYCAIKELTPISQSTSNLEKAQEFFKREAALLYQLQHPQIPRFWATFEEQGRLFLVQDYIAGKTYRTLLAERQSQGQQFSEAEVWRFLLQVLPVLGYIHSKGVIHRDLSPDNIILRESDHLPVVIDFGVVKEFANKLQVSSWEKPGILAVGKPGYAPPEQLAAGQSYPSSDLYALAVTAIVLLTGKEPSALFEGDRLNWTWRRWIHVSDGLVNVLHKMLNPKPSERYPSAVDVFQDLQSLSIPNAQPPETLDPGSSPPSPSPTRAVGEEPTPSMADRIHSAISYINVKSVWEKPQVFIPLGVLISILAGLAGWFGVKLTTQPGGWTGNWDRSGQPPGDAGPPKQADFNNPTITQGASVVDPNEPIQPLPGQPIIREGKVDANTPIRYKLAGITGQNLDISTGSNQVLMTILSPLGLPLDSPAAERVAGWRGQISSPGEYTIELRPIQGLTGNAFPYRLTIVQLAATPETLPTGTGIPDSNINPLPVNPSDNGGINSLPTNPSSGSENNLPPTFTPSPVPIEVPTTRPRRSKVEQLPPSNQRSTESQPFRRVKVRPIPQSNPGDSPTEKRQRRPAPSETQPESQPSPSVESPSVDIDVPLPTSTITPKSEPNPGDGGSPSNNTEPDNRSPKTTQPAPEPSTLPSTAPNDG
jgi:serine/threonine-protein kinase